MPDSLISFEILPAIREGEALFARGDDDALIRQEKRTQSDFEQQIALTIDDEKVTVPRATPVTDAQGNVRLGSDGRPIPRATTIYDAAAKLVKEGTWTQAELKQRIPILCHQDHMTPVAVCRMCAVHVSKFRKRDKGKPNARPVPADKLVPACQHEVQEDMIVTTRLGGVLGTDSEGFAGQVARATCMLTELLLADHHHPDPTRDDRFRNELIDVAQALDVDKPREGIARSEGRNLKLHRKSRPIPLPVVEPGEKPLPYSSRSIQVDHDRCILCDRCVRACSEVKPFKVIGHTGKGYRTRISFDLDQPMNESSCVQCGECMTSCPTGALTLNRRVNPLGSWPDAVELNRWVQQNIDYTPQGDDRRHPFPHLTHFNDPKTQLPPGFPAARELIDVSLTFTDLRGTTREYHPFEAIPLPYLRWNEGGVRKRASAGRDSLPQGRVRLDCVPAGIRRVRGAGSGSGNENNARAQGFGCARRNGGRGPEGWRRFDRRRNGVPDEHAADGHDSREDRRGRLRGHAEHAAHAPTYAIGPRGAGAVLRPTGRARLSEQRQALRRARGGTAAEAVERCRSRRGTHHRRARPGNRRAGQRHRPRRIGPASWRSLRGSSGLGRSLARRSRRCPGARKAGTKRVLRRDRAALRGVEGLGRFAGRLPRQSADRNRAQLDDVEVVRIKGDAFRKLFARWPELRAPMLEQCRVSLQGQRQAAPKLLGTYLSEGFFQGQKMLVLDLERCTRCDECTKACADAHDDGHSRLLREGPRFGKFLVATSCRSCHTPYCMDGCPVDAIHRGAMSLEVKIDAHCIGCSLCANNCPYESIQMVNRDSAVDTRERVAAVAQQAVNCDLCEGLVPAEAEPFCVSSCPHDAAFRWTGEKLYQKVAG